MSNQNTKTFHFDLSHLSSISDATFNVGLKQYPLQAHTPETLAEAAKTNRAIALIPASKRSALTHFATVPTEDMPTRSLARLMVTSPNGGDLPFLWLTAVYIPDAFRWRHRVRKFAGQTGTIVAPFKLRMLGIDEVEAADIVDVLGDADDIQTPADAATAVVFHHPELGSRDPFTATVVTEDSISSETNTNNMTNLADAISGQGQSGWAPAANATAPDGTTMTADFTVGSIQAGQPVQIYSLTDTTLAAGQPAVSTALTTSKQNVLLRNRTWSVTQGTTAVASRAGSPSAARRVAADSGIQWTVVNQSSPHGFQADPASIAFDGSTFSIDVTNTYLRSLGAFVQFFDTSNPPQPIANPSGWVEILTGLTQFFEPNPSKKFVSSVPAIDVVLGIPVPAEPTTLSFPFPAEAGSVTILGGGLGTSNWDSDVVWPGVVLTVTFEYGIPVLFLTAAAALESTQFFSNFLKETENVLAALAVGVPLAAAGVGGTIAVTQSSSILIKAADFIAGALLKKGLEEVAEWVIEALTESEFEAAIPFVGWAAKVAGIVVDLANLAETTAEVLSSPAALSIGISRAFALDVTVGPDPNHGDPDQPGSAVWPAVADHYVVTVQYKGGTSFQQTGQMPDLDSGTAISVTFPTLPAGGMIQVTTNVYSANNWLCGQFQSGWTTALPPQGSGTLALTGNITEILVPLTADSQYVYQQKITYDPSREAHVWQPGGAPPTDTLTDLDCGDSQSLCSLVDITINSTAFQVGYAWQTSQPGVALCTGATSGTQPFVFQNVSVLGSPESGLKFVNCALGAQPYIAYDQFGGIGSQTVSQANFYLDPRPGTDGNPNHIRQIVLDDGNSTIDLNASNLQSWGAFNLPVIDAMVVHPSGSVIAVSWAANKMELLTLPEASSDDSDAPVGQVVSGPGILQGLLGGPKALTVTLDGRVLVLESVNQRFQAFDTFGNPVASFLGTQLFTLPFSDVQPDLDAGTVPAALQTAFQQNNVTFLFNLDASLASSLTAGAVNSAILDAFSDEGIVLSFNTADPTDTTTNAVVSVVSTGESWVISDPARNQAFSLQLNGSNLAVFEVLVNVAIKVLAQGSQWVVTDSTNAASYFIQTDPTDATTVQVNDYLSYAPLYNPDNASVTYLDMAAESKGYIYVLSYTGDGSAAADYLLDIYDPTGAFLARTPNSSVSETPQNVAAAKLTVDLFRNLYALNYEAVLGPANRIEPSVSQWVPTPPLFELSLAAQPDFQNADVSAVQSDFGQNNVTLSSNLVITQISPTGHWTVLDNNSNATYDVIRSGSGLFAYLLPSGGRP